MESRRKFAQYAFAGCSVCNLMNRLGQIIGSSTFRRWSFLLCLSIALVYLTGGTSLRSWELPSSINAKLPSLSLVAREKHTQDLEKVSSSLNTPAELFSSNGLTTVVQWDQFSLVVKGQRIFLQCVSLLVNVTCAEFAVALESSTHSVYPYHPFGLIFFKK